MATFGVVQPLGDIVLEQLLARGGRRMRGVVSTTLNMTSLGSVAQQGLDEGCLTVNVHMTVALFCIMVTSMAGLTRVFALFYMLKMVGGRWWTQRPERAHKVLSLVLSGELAMAMTEE